MLTNDVKCVVLHGSELVPIDYGITTYMYTMKSKV